MLHFTSRTRSAAPAIALSVYATPALFVMGYPTIHKVGVPCRAVNYARDTACLTGSVTE